MTDKELVTHLKFIKLAAEFNAKPVGARAEALDMAIKAVEDRILCREIIERALRSSDPINFYKAQALERLGEILEVKRDNPEPAEKEQITFDDIL